MDDLRSSDSGSKRDRRGGETGKRVKDWIQKNRERRAEKEREKEKKEKKEQRKLKPLSSGGSTKRLIIYPFVVLIVVSIMFLFLAPACVVEGTLIATPSGPRPVEELQIGDEVWTQSPDGSLQIGRIRNTWPAWSWGSLRIRTSDGHELHVTASHPVATRDGWTPAGRLAAGMSVQIRDGWTTILSVDSRSSIVRVYDLEVGPNANFFAAGLLVHNKTSKRAANERNAVAALKTVGTAQAEFRGNDLDGNEKEDYWVGDIAGLYHNKTIDGEVMRLIEEKLAKADFAAVSREKPVAFRGYYFATIPQGAGGKPFGTSTNPLAFAVCAWPVEHDVSGRRTFIMNQDHTVWYRDRRHVARIMRWPADLEKEGWKALD